MAQLNVKLPPDDLDHLRRLAHRRKTTVSWLIRDYVRYLRAGGPPVEYDDEPSTDELLRLSAASGAFDWLADEPDLYSAADGEPL